MREGNTLTFPMYANWWHAIANLKHGKWWLPNSVSRSRLQHVCAGKYRVRWNHPRDVGPAGQNPPNPRVAKRQYSKDERYQRHSIPVWNHCFKCRWVSVCFHRTWCFHVRWQGRNYVHVLSGKSLVSVFCSGTHQSWHYGWNWQKTHSKAASRCSESSDRWPGKDQWYQENAGWTEHCIE